MGNAHRLAAASTRRRVTIVLTNEAVIAAAGAAAVAGPHGTAKADLRRLLMVGKKSVTETAWSTFAVGCVDIQGATVLDTPTVCFALCRIFAAQPLLPGARKGAEAYDDESLTNDLNSPHLKLLAHWPINKSASSVPYKGDDVASVAKLMSLATTSEGYERCMTIWTMRTNFHSA